MLQLIEFIPVLVFFIVYTMNGRTVEIGNFHYHCDGIYSATAAFMATSVILLPLIFLKTGKLEKRLLWMLALTLTMGSATLFFHNPRFIQWKFTVIYWLFSAVLLGSHFLTGKNIVRRLLGDQMELPLHTSTRLTFVWSGYFFVVGGLNLVVAYHFSEATWVSYKFYSSIVYTIFLSIITALIVAPHLQFDDKGDEKSSTGKTDSPRDIAQ